MPPKQTQSNSLMISKSLTELDQIKKEMTGVRKFIMVRKENERLEKELEDRLASAWW